jgi:hypothetical protein
VHISGNISLHSQSSRFVNGNQVVVFKEYGWFQHGKVTVKEPGMGDVFG